MAQPLKMASYVCRYTQCLKIASSFSLGPPYIWAMLIVDIGTAPHKISCKISVHTLGSLYFCRWQLWSVGVLLMTLDAQVFKNFLKSVKLNVPAQHICEPWNFLDSAWHEKVVLLIFWTLLDTRRWYYYGAWLPAPLALLSLGQGRPPLRTGMNTTLRLTRGITATFFGNPIGCPWRSKKHKKILVDEEIASCRTPVQACDPRKPGARVAQLAYKSWLAVSSATILPGWSGLSS